MDPQVTVQWLYVGVLFAMGALVGSFLNVVVYRMPLGMSLVSPPSSCPSCGAGIAARDNVPILGWLLLGGKCRRCGLPISVRYPLVEFITAVLWALEGWRLAGMHRGYWGNVFTGALELAFISAMIVTFLIDWDYRIILDEVSLGGLLTALWSSPFLPALHHAENKFVFQFYNPILAAVMPETAPWTRSLASSMFGAVVGLAFSLIIYHGGNVLFREQIESAKEEDPDVDSALGMGDVKLMTFFGAFLGWQAVFFIFLVGSVLASVYGTVMKLYSGDPGDASGVKGLAMRWETGDSVLAFGPFLAVAALVFLFLGDYLILSFL